MTIAEIFPPQELPSLADIVRDNPDWLDKPLSTEEAAAFCSHAPSTLETLRTRGGGPEYIKGKSLVFYTRRALLTWLWQGRRSHTIKADAPSKRQRGRITP